MRISALAPLGLFLGKHPGAGEGKREEGKSLYSDFCAFLGFPAAPQPGLGLCPAPGTIWEPLVCQAQPASAGGPGPCVHKDEECLFFLIDSRRINAGRAGKGLRRQLLTKCL